MFTSPMANKHFNFNARYIQLPMIHPMTKLTQEDDITMTEAHGDDDDHATTMSTSMFMEMDQELSVMKAAHTLLDIHHTASLHHKTSEDEEEEDEDNSTSNASSSDSTTTTEEEPSESSHSGSDRPTRGRKRQLEQQRKQHQPTTSGATAKPRWSDEERNKLLRAVIQEKGLDQLTTFDWQKVAEKVDNHTHTACRDRWRDHLLPGFQQLYSIESSSTTSCSASSSE